MSGVGGVCPPSGDGGRDLEDFLDNAVVNSLVMLFFFLRDLVAGDVLSIEAANGSAMPSVAMVKSCSCSIETGKKWSLIESFDYGAVKIGSSRWYCSLLEKLWSSRAFHSCMGTLRTFRVHSFEGFTGFGTGRCPPISRTSTSLLVSIWQMAMQREEIQQSCCSAGAGRLCIPRGFPISYRKLGTGGEALELNRDP